MAANGNECTANREKGTRQQLRSAWPLLLSLVRPRRRILALGLLVMIANRAAGLVLPFSTKILVDNVVTAKQVHLLLPLVLAIIGAMTFQGITTFVLTQLLGKEGHRMVADLRCRVQKHVARLPVAYYDNTKASVIASRIIWDIDGVGAVIGTGLMDLLGGAVLATLSVIILLNISVILTCAALFTIAVFAVFLNWALRRMRPVFRQQSDAVAKSIGRLVESFEGVRVTKGYHAQAQEGRVFETNIGALMKILMRIVNHTSGLMLVATILIGVVSALVTYLGAQEMLSGRLTLGGFMMFCAFLAVLIAPTAQAVSIGTNLTQTLAGLDRVQEILTQLPEDEEPGRIRNIGPVHGAVVFEDVTFAYEPGVPVLRDVSFEARPGTVTALVGPSGSGKSTIISLIAAFHTPGNGTIRVDGEDLSTIRLNTYRTQLGVVFQETFLFDGTIWENVAYSCPGASEAEVLEACRLARVDVFAELLEHKYETAVGERGVKLSGGQRQRLSIARAILANPRILILDEATASLDSESEAAIQEGLSYLLQGRTTFVIAHRLSTIRGADQILLIEDGRLIERGSHVSLYAQGGRYYEMYTRQHGVDAELMSRAAGGH